MKGKAVREADKKRRAQEAREQRNKVAKSDHQGRNRSTPNISTPRQQQTAPQKISRKSGFPRQFLGRLFWLANTPWKIAVEAAVILMLFFDLWAVFSVVPVVSAPVSVDPGDLFRTPFSVSNPHYFFTLYNVHPVCGFDESLGFLRQEFALEAEIDVGDLPPQGSPATFVCRVGGRPVTPGVRLFLTMHYDVRLLPGFYWPRTREFSYRVALSGEGTAYWQEGEWLYRPPSK
jgi:hypothetical protein